MICHLSTNFTLFFFFNVPATTEIYTLSLHDALPICIQDSILPALNIPKDEQLGLALLRDMPDDNLSAAIIELDRKSTRLNSSHQIISYAVFCLKKKKNRIQHSENLLQIYLRLDLVLY